MKKIVIALLFSVVYCLTTVAQIGTWKNYLAYHDVQQIQAAGNDQLFVLASNSLYQYNKNDQSIVTYDKVNGLSDTYITHIRWCQQAKRLITVYGNTNIDLIDTKGNVTNISDIYTKVITGEKSINSIHINNQYAYLACGFGIVKLNVQRAEISESYMFGFAVSAVTISGNTIYAQTSQGILEAQLTANLIDTSNWKQSAASPSFTQDNSDYTDNIELVKTLNPGGPIHNKFGFMRFINGNLYTCGGAFYTPATIQVLKGTEWQNYQSEDISSKTGVSFVGSICLDVEQTSQGDHLFVGGRNGLYEYQDGNFVNYYGYQNSPIESFTENDAEYQLVTGVIIDAGSNLWILNSQAPTASLIKYSNGQFTKLNHSELMKLNDNGYTNKSNGRLGNIIFDSNGIMWFVNNHGWLPALYRYDTTADMLTEYSRMVNQDGTTVNIAGDGGVRCVAEDIQGNMWIGTSAGPLMLEKGQMDNSNYYFTQVKVPRNDGTNYADYLLSGIDITCMTIDGGGRKWFGTNTNGVYLISADNMTQVHHFTTDNSPLLSNAIQSVTINPSTGEVFFGTENGLCSYISDATQTNAEMTEDNVWAYPNPVNPDFTGMITITGLTLNADIKIVASNGALITKGKSNGGTFQWDGCDSKGRRVASGVYMVVTATNSGQKGTVCKIAIVR